MRHNGQTRRTVANDILTSGRSGIVASSWECEAAFVRHTLGSWNSSTSGRTWPWTKRHRHF